MLYVYTYLVPVYNYIYSIGTCHVSCGCCRSFQALSTHFLHSWRIRIGNLSTSLVRHTFGRKLPERWSMLGNIVRRADGLCLKVVAIVVAALNIV